MPEIKGSGSSDTEICVIWQRMIMITLCYIHILFLRRGPESSWLIYFGNCHLPNHLPYILNDVTVHVKQSKNPSLSTIRIDLQNDVGKVKVCQSPHCYANLLEKIPQMLFCRKERSGSFSLIPKKVFHFKVKKGSFKQEASKQGTLMKICLKWDIKDYVLNALSSKAKTQNEWLCNPRFIPLSTL